MGQKVRGTEIEGKVTDSDKERNVKKRECRDEREKNLEKKQKAESIETHKES